MTWTFKHADILDEPADVLVCSANVFLNLSGGVGGAILLRCGRGMQDELHAHLAARNGRFVQRGEVVQSGPWGLPFKAVLHAVAVDGFYQTSVDVVSATISRSLEIAAGLGAKRVALTALGTGFGRLKMRDFGRAVAALRNASWPPIESVVVCVRTADDRDALASAFNPA